MKTSNKLLLGILLTMLILIATVQLMVYAKFKRGEYAKFKREQFVPMTSLQVPNVRFISLKGLDGCVVKPGEKLKVEIQQDNANLIKYQVVNDTLVIISTTQTIDQLEGGSRNNSLVKIHMPASVQIKGAYSSFRVWGANDSVAAPTYTISLEKGSFLYFDYKGPENGSVYFNQLNVNCEQSVINMGNHVILNALNLQLMDNSRINDNGFAVGKITIDADNTSFISLSGKNFKALK